MADNPRKAAANRAEPITDRRSGGDRRANEALRALVGEMLERVRDLSRRTAAWSPEERAQAEAELESIMASVRREATRSREKD
ncbi:MAG TPA: hypothetical protein VMT93_07595 [Gemmatimonadaceae bacterium]|nr:hypothetical protein [Gemmatimonadaceae bacterium]